MWTSTRAASPALLLRDYFPAYCQHTWSDCDNGCTREHSDSAQKPVKRVVAICNEWMAYVRGSKAASYSSSNPSEDTEINGMAFLAYPDDIWQGMQGVECLNRLYRLYLNVLMLISYG